MDRVEYNTCMKPYISGQHEDRKGDFCIGAKICSGKASDEEEATRLCADAAAVAAANPKPKKPRGKSKIDVAALATCIMESVDGEINQAKLVSIISGCTGQKVQKVEPILTKKEFIKKCYKKNPMSTGVLGSRAGIQEMRELQAMCKAKWEEQGGSL